MLFHKTIVNYPEDQPPRLIVVVDTEEEFDWSKPPNPASTSVDSIREIYRVQDIFDDYGIVPCYVVDYPIASQKLAVDCLKPILESKRCELGSHLHPWVNPPLDEDVSPRNTYPGNLAYDLELSKLQLLSTQIQESFGINPKIYKAGRYGIGKNTPLILKKLGYEIDLSVCSAFDYRDDGGPDFSDFSSDPFWFGENGDLLEIPVSGAFVGVMGSAAKHLYGLAGKFETLRARGVLSRLGIVDRLMLSPEGYSTEEHKSLTRHLLGKGVRTFTWNFHSPTVVPRMTMYTRTEYDVSKFLDSFRRYFDFFIEEMGGVLTTPTKIKQELETRE